jgi:hypothetical protein
VTEPTELPAANLLITDLGDDTYRLTFGNKRRYVAVIMIKVKSADDAGSCPLPATASP